MGNFVVSHFIYRCNLQGIGERETKKKESDCWTDWAEEII